MNDDQDEDTPFSNGVSWLVTAVFSGSIVSVLTGPAIMLLWELSQK